jgi:HTH-type transcriptional regulator / antitoxin HigA
VNIAPIRNDPEHRAALAEIEKLWRAPEGSDDAIKLDLLATMVERYEAARWPIPSPKWDPVGVLQYAIAEMGHSQAELAQVLGSRSRASEILSRRRALTTEMIHKIHVAWKIPAELLIRPYKLRKRVA